MLEIIKKTMKVLTPWERKRLSLLMGLDVVTSVADIAFLAALLYVVNTYANNALLSLWPIGIFFLLFPATNVSFFVERPT